MGAAASIVAIAAGAILDFAVKVQNSHGFNLNRVGLILMIVGVVGLLISMFFWRSWGGFSRSSSRRVVTNTPGSLPVDGSGRVVEQPGTTYVEERQQRY